MSASHKQRRIRPTAGRLVLGGVLLATGVALTAFGINAWQGASPQESADPPAVQVRRDDPEKANSAKLPPAQQRPPEPPIDVRAVRRKAWAATQPRLAEANRQAQAELDRAVARLRAFFAERRQGCKPFAEAILSLRGKWKFVKSSFTKNGPDEHLRFLASEFESHVFSSDDLQHEVRGTLAAYVAGVQSVENRLLVALRADINTDPSGRRVLPELATDDAFRASYDHLVREAASDAQHAAAVELGVFVSWQVIGQTVMQEMATKVLFAVTSKIATSAGIVSTGAASGVATFGVGVVVGILLDVGFDWIMRQTGNDAASQVAAKIEEKVDQLGRWIVDGHPEAVKLYDIERRNEREHTDDHARKAAGEAADKIAAGGHLGLRRELMRVHNARRQLRETALERLILGDEAGERK